MAVYSIAHDAIEVTTMTRSEPDDAWREIDPAGHVHTHTSGSWAWKVTAEWVNADGDDDSDGHYACTSCGDEVHPRWVSLPGGFRQYVSGPQRFYRDAVEITRAEFESAMGLV